MTNLIIKMSTQEVAAIILDKRIHKATHEVLISISEQISGFAIDLENEPTTREECIEYIRAEVLAAREELEFADAEPVAA